MRCPNCGTLMNRHAEKLLKAGHPEESVPSDTILDELIASIHCCPGCGKVEAVTEPLDVLPEHS